MSHYVSRAARENPEDFAKFMLKFFAGLALGSAVILTPIIVTSNKKTDKSIEEFNGSVAQKLNRDRFSLQGITVDLRKEGPSIIKFSGIADGSVVECFYEFDHDFLYNRKIHGIERYKKSTIYMDEYSISLDCTQNSTKYRSHEFRETLKILQETIKERQPDIHYASGVKESKEILDKYIREGNFFVSNITEQEEFIDENDLQLKTKFYVDIINLNRDGEVVRTSTIEITRQWSGRGDALLDFIKSKGEGFEASLIDTKEVDSSKSKIKINQVKDLKNEMQKSFPVNESD